MAFDWGNAFKGGAVGGAAGGPIGVGAGALFGGFMGNGDEDFKKAGDWLDKIPDELRNALMPYINAGKGALPQLQGASDEYQRMYQDPNAIISRIGGGYRQSPGYQWKLNQGENAITNAAAAGGMAGTGQHQQQAGELAGNLADQDYQAYLDKALGLYSGGLAGRTGIEQNIYGIGAGAGGSLGTGIANYLQGRGGLSYAQGANKNQANSDFFSSILSYLGKK